jgi:hypothetical protein
MDAAPQLNISSTSFYFILAIFIAVVVGAVSFMLIKNINTVPSGKWNEGFQGPPNGVSTLTCGQESSEAVNLAELFSSRDSSTGEGSDDLRELKLILSKLCCMKHDLMSPAQKVDSTLYLPYQSTHDHENPADTVGRCFTKSIPPRDLDISFATWKGRGMELVNRLCTSYNLSPREVDQAKKYFMAVWMDVFSIAKTVCIPHEKVESGSPRDLVGFTPENLEDLGPYKGYY